MMRFKKPSANEKLAQKRNSVHQIDGAINPNTWTKIVIKILVVLVFLLNSCVMDSEHSWPDAETDRTTMGLLGTIDFNELQEIEPLGHPSSLGIVSKTFKGRFASVRAFPDRLEGIRTKVALQEVPDQYAFHFGIWIDHTYDTRVGIGLFSDENNYGIHDIEVSDASYLGVVYHGTSLNLAESAAGTVRESGYNWFDSQYTHHARFLWVSVRFEREAGTNGRLTMEVYRHERRSPSDLLKTVELELSAPHPLGYFWPILTENNPDGSGGPASILLDQFVWNTNPPPPFEPTPLSPHMWVARFATVEQVEALRKGFGNDYVYGRCRQNLPAPRREYQTTGWGGIKLEFNGPGARLSRVLYSDRYYVDSSGTSIIRPDAPVGQWKDADEEDLRIIKSWADARNGRVKEIDSMTLENCTFDNVSTWFNSSAGEQTPPYYRLSPDWTRMSVIETAATAMIERMQSGICRGHPPDLVYLDVLARGRQNEPRYAHFTGDDAMASHNIGQMVFARLVQEGLDAHGIALHANYNGLPENKANHLAATWSSGFFRAVQSQNEGAANNGRLTNGTDPETGRPAYVIQGIGWVPANVVLLQMSSMGNDPTYDIPEFDGYTRFSGGHGSSRGHPGGHITIGLNIQDPAETAYYYRAHNILHMTIPKLDDDAGIPLNQRSWDGEEEVYDSTKNGAPWSHISKTIAFSRNQTGTVLYAAPTASGTRIQLGPDERIVEALSCNRFFDPTTASGVTGDDSFYTFSNGRIVFGNSAPGKGFRFKISDFTGSP